MPDAAEFRERILTNLFADIAKSIQQKIICQYSWTDTSDTEKEIEIRFNCNNVITITIKQELIE